MLKKSKNMHNIINIKKIILLIITSIILIYLLVTSIFSVCFTDKRITGFSTGFSFLEEGGEVIKYYCNRSIVNISIFSKEVTVEAYSRRDAATLLIAEPELSIKSLELFYNDEDRGEEKGILCEGNTFTIPPLSSVSMSIECEGKYGGVGSGARHGPDLKIESERIIW